MAFDLVSVMFAFHCPQLETTCQKVDFRSFKDGSLEPGRGLIVRLIYDSLDLTFESGQGRAASHVEHWAGIPA